VQTVSKEFLLTLRESHVVACRADLYLGTEFGVKNETLAIRDLHIIEGSVTASRKDNVRRTCDLTIALDPWLDLPEVDIYRGRIQLYYGIEAQPGNPEMLPMGRFRVNDFGRANRGVVTISGTSYESFLIDDRFFQPRKPPLGVSTIAAIKVLIGESVPGAKVIVTATKDKNTVMTSPWARERWEAVTVLAESIAAEVYCDPEGSFVIANKPNFSGLASATAVWAVNEGPDGVLVSLDTKRTIDSVYNAVVAFQSNTDTGITPVWASVVDTFERSKTYWNGPFGHVPRFYSNPNFRTRDQCLSAARGMLAESIAEKRSVDFSMVPNPALEPGDIVRISMLDGTSENHVIDQLTMSLSTGAWSATTKTSKNDIQEEESK